MPTTGTGKVREREEMVDFREGEKGLVGRSGGKESDLSRCRSDSSSDGSVSEADDGMAAFEGRIGVARMVNDGERWRRSS